MKPTKEKKKPEHRVVNDARFDEEHRLKSLDGYYALKYKEIAEFENKIIKEETK